ncbi:MAG: GNAT family N-acetyltransferase [Sandaracinaceae bacterium]
MTSTKGAPAASPPRGAIRIRRAKLTDVAGIYMCQRAAYGLLPEAALNTPRLIELQLKAFPEGHFVAVDRAGTILGYTSTLIVTIDEDSPWYSYAEITGDGTFATHMPSGDTLYGADIAVHPDIRGTGIAKRLYDARIRLVRRFNLRRMVAGGRIPGYQEHSGRLTAEQYVEEVEAGTLFDPTLSVQLKIGYRVRGVHHGYLRDAESLDYATFLELENPTFNPQRRRIAAAPLRRPVRRVRVCAAQYGMRPVTGWPDVEHQVSFFADTAQQYHCHFLVLPELFTAQLFTALDPALSPREAIAALADQADRYRSILAGLATKHELYIVGGSHPTRVENGEIRNTAHLFTPNGEVHTQDKLHVTPAERDEYGISPGTNIYLFETAYARIGIPVCYDIEFPELCRLLAIAGAEILMTPFSTDERRAYLRVRYSAHARAVENVVYVVLSGSVGNLPQVENFLINYGQAAICTPSDIAFPGEGIAAVAETTTETVVIADLDLDALHLAREIGSVRPFRDRRLDLYDLTAKQAVEHIRVG